jgi:23S rRNA A2030 N6-methylase RlmJ
MARTINRQLGNVGNLGDIIKHAALVELATLLARGTSAVSFVDTHTFQLHAPLPDRKRWERHMEALSKRHPAYERYAALERTSLARTRQYRCSSGLVLDALGERCACAVLGESNAASRAEISSQLAAEIELGAESEENASTHANVHVVDDASAVDRDARVPPGGALLIHVDPFALSTETWSTFAPALHAMAARSTHTAMVVYRYSRGARTAWPEAPLPAVAETRGGPHEVAAYASEGIADAVRDVCGSLGWAVVS